MKTKSKIKRRKLLYKQYIQNDRFKNDFVLLETFITELNELNSSSISLYYEKLGKKKLNNLLLQSKLYW